MQRRPMAISC